jgi:hypothetical protein
VTAGLDHEAAASGEGPCEDDDEDCETGSGTGDAAANPVHKANPDDIGFNQGATNNEDDAAAPDNAEDTEDTEDTVVGEANEKGEDDDDDDVDAVVPRSTTTDTMVVTVDMTETPPKKNPGFGGVSTRRPPPVEDVVTVNHGEAEDGGEGGASGSGGGAGGGAGSTGGGASEPNLDQSQSDSPSLGLNIGLIVGIAAGVVLLLLILAYAFYKYKSHDDGGYKMDETKNYRYDSCNTKPPPPLPPSGHVNGTMQKSATTTPTKPKKKDVKEWYV